MKALDNIFLALLIVGGLNWGLVGVANFNLVATLFGAESILSKIVYTLVGISAIYTAVRALSPAKSQSVAYSSR